jgi:hypothetical protein
MHLAALFAAVAGDASDDLARGAAWVEYIQSTIRSTAPALDADGTEILHPLWLLEHRYLQCGQIARLVVDGFSAVGIPARVLQLKGHVSAEFYAAGRWRFADADILSAGEFVRDAYGEHASLDDILANPTLLGTVHPYSELTSDVEQARRTYQEVFEPAAYDESSLTTPYVVKKVAPRSPAAVMTLWWLNGRLARDAQSRTAHAYGWNYYVLCNRADPACTN